MAQKRESPPGGTGGAQNCHSLAAFERSEHNPPSRSLQDLRAAFITRRHRLAPGMAAAVAGLAFETKEAR